MSGDGESSVRAATAATEPWYRSWRGAFAAVMAGHLALLCKILPLSSAFGDVPVVGTDYALHWYRATTVGHHFVPSGRLWGYDTRHVAGGITGTVHDLDNKAIELAVGTLGPLVGDARAFNLFLFFAFLAIPLALFAGARLLRLGPWPAVWAAVLGSLAFHGEPYVTSWTLFGGFGHVLASVVAPFAVALLARRVELRTNASAWLLLAAAPLFYVHVLSALFTAVLGLALLPLAVRASRRTVVVTIATVIGIVVINLPWIVPMLGDWSRIAPSPATPPEPRLPFAPLWEYLGRSTAYGIVVPVLAGAVGLVTLWRCGRRDVAATFALGGASIFVTAFEGYRSSFLHAMIEPTRLKATVPFVFAIPAGLGLHRIWKWAVDRWGATKTSVCIAVLVVACYPVTIRPIVTRAFGTAHLRIGLEPGAVSLFDKMRSLGDPNGRLALEEIGPFDGGKPPFRAYLAAVAPLHTGRDLIGGPYYRGFTPEKIAAFVNGKLMGTPLDELDDREIMRRLDLLDVTGIAACQVPSIERLRASTGIVDEVGEEPPYVLFAVRRQADRCLVGRAEVRAQPDRIEVRPESAEPLVLKFHYDHRLTAPDAIELSAEPVFDGDPGFIRVEGHGGRPFVISTR